MSAGETSLVSGTNILHRQTSFFELESSLARFQCPKLRVWHASYRTSCQFKFSEKISSIENTLI